VETIVTGFTVVVVVVDDETAVLLHEDTCTSEDGTETHKPKELERESI
jgi:hypothetical protein